MKVWLHRAAWHVLSPVILSWTHRLSHLLCRDVLRPLLCLTTTLLLNMALSSTFASITNPFLSSLWEFIFATYFPQLLVWTPVCWSALSCWLFMSVSPIPLKKKKQKPTTTTKNSCYQACMASTLAASHLIGSLRILFGRLNFGLVLFLQNHQEVNSAWVIEHVICRKSRNLPKTSSDHCYLE